MLAVVFIVTGLGFLLTTIATVALLGGAFFGVADAQAALEEATSGTTIASAIQAAAGVVAGVLILRGVFLLSLERERIFGELDAVLRRISRGSQRPPTLRLELGCRDQAEQEGRQEKDQRCPGTRGRRFRQSAATVLRALVARAAAMVIGRCQRDSS